MTAPHFPVNFDSIRANISYQDTCVEHYTLGSMVITPIPISHPNQGTGYKFEEDGKCFVFLTDNELSYKHEGGLDFQKYLEFSSGAELLCTLNTIRFAAGPVSPGRPLVKSVEALKTRLLLHNVVNGPGCAVTHKVLAARQDKV